MATKSTVPAGKPPVAPSAPSAGSDLPRVSLSQTELYFPLPINANVENTVELHNPESSLVLFKVKTCDVQRYLVRPRVGVIQPRTSTKVHFVLLADRAANLNADTKDQRFSVQIRFAAKDEPLNDPAACWDNDKSAGPNGHPHHKVSLPCRFVPKDELPSNVTTRTEMQSPFKRTNGQQQSNSNLNTPRSAVPTGGHYTPMSVASPVTGPNEDFSKQAGRSAAAIAEAAAATIGDPAQSALAAARRSGNRASAAVPKLDISQATTSPLAPTPSAATRQPTPATSTNSKSPAMVARPPPTPSSPLPTTTTKKDDDGKHRHESRRSGFQQVFKPKLPIVFVLPLMALCFYIGMNSAYWLAYFETFLQRLQLAIDVLQRPTMAA